MERPPDLVCLTEYIQSVLYFAIVRPGRTLKSTAEVHYFSIDEKLIYENYYSDFGPLKLSCVYKYCRMLNEKFKTFLNRQRIVHYTSSDPKKKSNSAYLLGCYGVLYLNLTPSDALKPLLASGQTFRNFQDAIQGESCYTITLLDCLNGIKKAKDVGLFNFQDFNCDEYDRLDKIQGGDLNWIVPGKYLAFIGPVDYNYGVSLYHPPEIYVDYFLENNVLIVIRLNKKFYDGNVFTNMGIKHYDLFFPDGSCPPRHILVKFLQISEDNADCAIAVHCKGWLEQLEPWLLKQGNSYRRQEMPHMLHKRASGPGGEARSPQSQPPHRTPACRRTEPITVPTTLEQYLAQDQQQRRRSSVYTVAAPRNPSVVKNVEDAKNALSRSSYQKASELKRSRKSLEASLVVTQAPNVSTLVGDNSPAYAGSAVHYHTASRTSAPNRARLGRSPSPPPTRKVSQRSTTTSTHTLAQSSTPKSSVGTQKPSALQEALSKLQTGIFLARERSVGAASMGAASLGARRDAPSAPSARSDDRARATQGDLLNSIKFERRMRQASFTKAERKSIAVPSNGLFEEKHSRGLSSGARKERQHTFVTEAGALPCCPAARAHLASPPTRRPSYRR